MNESDPLVLSEIAEAIPVLSIAQTRREREREVPLRVRGNAKIRC